MQISNPTIEQVKQLPRLLTLTIPEEWEDYNGHVNIQYYTTMFERGGWPMMEKLGASERYFSERRMGFFDLEHHTRYLAEVHVGEEVSIYCRFLQANPKRFHGMLFIVNESQQQLASTMEYVTASVNLAIRKTVAFPDDIIKALEQQLQSDNTLQWPAPVCGVMSI